MSLIARAVAVDLCPELQTDVGVDEFAQLVHGDPECLTSCVDLLEIAVTPENMGDPDSRIELCFHNWMVVLGFEAGKTESELRKPSYEPPVELLRFNWQKFILPEYDHDLLAVSQVSPFC